MSAGHADRVRRAYDGFAEFYDAFTAGHEDARWASALETAARAAGLSGDRLLDLGCGTGRSFLPMLEHGYRVVGVDVSPRMLEVASRKAGGRARLVEADLTELPALGAFDLVWSLGDALNYVPGGALGAVFAGAAANLAEHGILAFDLNTLGSFRTVYSSLEVRPSDAEVLVLDGHGDPQLRPGASAGVTIERLRARDGGGGWLRTRTEHVHHHHPDERVEAALASAGLEPVARYGSRPDGTLEQPLDAEHHVKAVYTARPARA